MPCARFSWSLGSRGRRTLGVEQKGRLLKLNDDYSATIIAQVGWKEIPGLIDDLWDLVRQAQNREVEMSPAYRRMNGARW